MEELNGDRAEKRRQFTQRLASADNRQIERFMEEIYQNRLMLREDADEDRHWAISEVFRIARNRKLA